jgi:hypothetical protein
MSRRPPPSRPFLNLLCSLCTFPCAASCERFWTVHRCCRRILYHPDPAPSTPALLPPLPRFPSPLRTPEPRLVLRPVNLRAGLGVTHGLPNTGMSPQPRLGRGPTPPPTPPNTSMASAHQLAASHWRMDEPFKPWAAAVAPSRWAVIRSAMSRSSSRAQAPRTLRVRSGGW